jgi:ABC-2 type transport system permease protein
MQSWLAVAEREILRYLKVWTQTLIPPILQAVLFILIFGAALGPRIREVGGVPYLDFIAPGLVMMGIINAAYSNSSTSLYDSRMRMYIEDILTAPVSDLELASAYVIGAASRGLIVGTGTILIVILFTDLAWQNPLLVLYHMVAVSIIFACLGCWFGLWGMLWDHVFLPLTFVLTPLTFLGGVFYSVAMLPDGWRQASYLNPILYMVDGMRYGMVGVSDAPVLAGAMGIGATAIGMFLITVMIFRSGYRLRT